MHVAIVIDGLGWGGAEMLLSDFAPAAAGAGLSVSVTYLQQRASDPGAQRLRSVGIEPVLVPIAGLLDPESFLALRAHVAALGPTIVHTHLGYADLLGGAVAWSLGIPAVSTVHLHDWGHEGGVRDAVKLQLFARSRRRFADRVVTVSDAARAAYLAQRWDRPERVVTLHNGVLGRPRPEAGTRIRQELGLGRDEVVVAMLSVLREGKGHDVAVRAVHHLRRRVPNVRLLIVGDGPQQHAIAELASRSEGAAVLAGHRDDVMDVLDAADILLHPSTHDAFPTALLEAMAASVPVVASAVGGIPEIVVDGVTGVLLPPQRDEGDIVTALTQLIDHPEERRRMGAAGRQRFTDHFSADRWASRTRELYEEILLERRMNAISPTARSTAALRRGARRLVTRGVDAAARR